MGVSPSCRDSWNLIPDLFMWCSMKAGTTTSLSHSFSSDQTTVRVRRAREKGEAIPENPPGPGLGGLFDPGTVILTGYAIVIGRRATLSGVDNERRANELQWSKQS